MKEISEQIKHCIGVSLIGKSPIEIGLEVKADQWLYLEASPFHSSQKKLSQINDKVQFSLYVIDNYEFRQALFWHLGKVKVITPIALVESIKKEENPYYN